MPPDPAYRFGRLDNGMRYIIRPNGTPAAQGMVQLWVDDGSVAETEQERGFAHFVEHMSFNGSTRVPEGEMVRLLEREGLAFGPDTNASTNYEVTLYKLDLPRNAPALLDTALMLMRETASELTFDPAAVEREKGVILAERRVRDTYQLREYQDGVEFQFPGARFVNRQPIGTVESLPAATAEGLRAFYRRVYRPENTALIVVGDYDPDAVEAAIRKHFASWQPSELVPDADPGPIAIDHAGETDIHIDQALSERVTVSRNGGWLDQTDTLAFRQANVRRQIAYAIVNRRLQSLALAEDPPFRGAGLGTAELFKIGRTTQLIVDSGDGEWRKGLAAAQAEYRRALAYGFTEAEVAEQVANLRDSLENNVASAATRGNGSFITAALSLLEQGQVPTTPESALERFEDHLPQITAQSVLAALKEELVPLDNPLIRFEGRRAPASGAPALRAAWNDGLATQLAAPERAAAAPWAYTDFGRAGSVVGDRTEPLLGIRELTFSNGLKVSLKRTELQRGRIAAELNIDGGRLLNTREDPLATAMDDVLPVGGLGKHSTDQLQSILAGRSVSFGFNADEETFAMGANTTQRDLELQLQLFAAAVTDPGLRPQGESQYRRSIRNTFARRTATPNLALSNALGGILSDNDPRFTLQPQEAYLALTYPELMRDIGDRLARGAMELALVGDFDEAAAIDAISRTLGALPTRETAFRDYADNRVRSFTADRSPRLIEHDGPADQAIVRFTWPTTDGEDEVEELKLELLESVMRLALTDTLREQLGQTYSPAVNASQSDVHIDYGTFNIAASVETSQVSAAREAMLVTVRALIAAPPEADTLLRARQPMLEAYDSALKSNRGWLNLVERAQRRPDRIARFMAGRARLAAVTGADVQATAARYLDPVARVEILVLPRGSTPPG